MRKIISFLLITTLLIVFCIPSKFADTAIDVDITTPADIDKSEKAPVSPSISVDTTDDISGISLDELNDKIQLVNNYIQRHSDACMLLVEHLLQTYEDALLVVKEGMLYMRTNLKGNYEHMPVADETQRLFEETGEWFLSVYIGNHLVFSCEYVIVIHGIGIRTFGPI
ncbi:MAG: hypothetical protein FWF47_04325 [Clostridia bacterium]|nr:hypothetical protein [Clostridia bacterium]